MVTDRVRIDGLAAGRDHLAGDRPEGSVLVVTIDQRVPYWLGELALAATEVGAIVIVEAAAPDGLEDEARAGWEVGVATAALAAGAVDVAGIAPERVARVREITASIDRFAGRGEQQP